MAQYKTVSGPITTVIKTVKEFEDAIAMQADVINRECVGGWEFYAIYPFTVTKQAKGIMNKLKTSIGFDMEDGTYSATMLVFKKD
ncbi:MAG: hypothetical protein GXZ04_01230 [Clostridiales bacterium]|nr:hypothetical protein [Clostridiales bacterium]